MAELVDATVLGAVAARRVGSTPSIPTKLVLMNSPLKDVFICSKGFGKSCPLVKYKDLHSTGLAASHQTRLMCETGLT